MRVEWAREVEVILDETVPEDEMWLCGGLERRDLIAKFKGVAPADLRLPVDGGERGPGLLVGAEEVTSGIRG